MQAKTTKTKKRKPKPFPLAVGTNVFIRTVTHYLTGRVADVGRDWIKLDDAAWVAWTKRFSVSLATGEFETVEPVPGWCIVGRGAIVDAFPWDHPLPRTAIG